jgi:hypothetical protein
MLIIILLGIRADFLGEGEREGEGILPSPKA